MTLEKILGILGKHLDQILEITKLY